MPPDALDLTLLRSAVIKRRERKGWTTWRLAQRSGVADPYLRRFEAGETEGIGLEILVRLAGALDVPVDDLLAEGGLAPSHNLADEAEVVYSDLGSIERRAWLRMGHTLRDIQAEYAALTEHEERRVAEDGEELEEVPDAAHPVTEAIREARRDAEDYEER